MDHETLRLERLKRRISARSLARKLKVTPGALSRWESGIRKPTDKHAKAWEKALSK